MCVTISPPCSCIEKWLRSAGGGAKCPQCNLKAKRGDLRVVFAKAVSVQDTTERDQALRELEQEKQLRIQAQRNEAQALLQQNLARSECDRLKEEVAKLRAQLEFYMASSRGSREGGELLPPGDSARYKEDPLISKRHKREGKYCPLESVPVTQVREPPTVQCRPGTDIISFFNQNGSARVMAYDAEQGMLVVSKFHSDRAMSGNGIQKVVSSDVSALSFHWLSLPFPV